MKNIKRIASIVMVLVLTCVVFATGAMADSSASVSWEVINGGTQVKATVNMPDAEILNARVTITFNAAKLTPNEAASDFSKCSAKNIKADSVLGNFFTTTATTVDVLYTVVFDITEGSIIETGDYGVDASSYYGTAAGERVTSIANGTLVCSHNYSDWTQTKAPTCKDDGEKTRTCGTCGNVDTEAIPATGEHVYTSVVTEPTCTEEGYTTYTCGCGESYVGDKVAAKGHNYVKDEAQSLAATCNTDGKDVLVCSCGDVKEEVVKATGDHVYSVEVERVEATCTEDGHVKYACGCGTVSEDATVLPKLGHKFENYTETKAPTCTDKGEETAACANGCGETDTKEIAAKGHAYGDYTETKAPTCTEKGEKTATCGVCGNVDTQEIKANGHDWGEWKVTKEATKTEKGEKVRVCEAEGCDATETKEIPATGSVAPKTGDEANIALYAVMFMMAAAGVVVLSLKKKEN